MMYDAPLAATLFLGPMGRYPMYDSLLLLQKEFGTHLQPPLETQK